MRGLQVILLIVAVIVFFINPVLGIIIGGPVIYSMSRE
jgi:hypothetical protein